MAACGTEARDPTAAQDDLDECQREHQRDRTAQQGIHRSKNSLGAAQRQPGEPLRTVGETIPGAARSNERAVSHQGGQSLGTDLRWPSADPFWRRLGAWKLPVRPVPRHAWRGGRMHGSYRRFAAMLLTSTAIMFGLMYSLVYEWDHVHFSDTRFFMALYMGAMMSAVMLAFMLGMYRSARTNVVIFIASALVFVGGLALARSQRTVGDVAYMKAMIPHHSIAILTSSRARISDPRVRKLADGIIAAQQREIAEMEALIRELDRR